jgi:hypothetical protein
MERAESIVVDQRLGAGITGSGHHCFSSTPPATILRTVGPARRLWDVISALVRTPPAGLVLVTVRGAWQNESMISAYGVHAPYGSL